MTASFPKRLQHNNYMEGSATIPDGPAALPEAILLMALLIISMVIGSLWPSTGLFCDRYSGFHGNGIQHREEPHNALSMLLSSSSSESWPALFLYLFHDILAEGLDGGFS